MRLLIVDDDRYLTKALVRFLSRQSYLVEFASDGQQAWEYVQSRVYDLIVLDVMLPKLDGVSLCQKLRQAGYTLPILLLTARSSSSDKVAGLNAGADDYVIKPFDWQELLARIRALLRRDNSLPSSILRWGDLSLDSQTCEVSYANQAIALRPREYRLLELFLRNPNRVFSCGAILENLWSFEDSPSEETVRSHIKGLRQKLRQAEVAEPIETVYGLGYRLKSAEEKLPGEDPTPAVSAAATQAAPLDLEVQQSLRQALSDLWDEVKPEILTQVADLEQAIGSVQAGTAPPALREQAIATAHKLAGTVGAYGFMRGSQLARHIEAQLQRSPHHSTGVETLPAQLKALRQELNAPLSQPAQPRRALATAQTARLLAVDDDPHLLCALKAILEPWGLSLTTLSDADQFWQVLAATAPDLLLLDIEMPQLSGIQLCEEIRNHPSWAGLPVVFLTAHADSETVQRVFLAGADDFVSKPIVGPELVTRVTTRIERHRYWQQLTERDGLTQLINRAQFAQRFQRLLQTAEQPIAFVLLQINNLQSINHQYGYQVGDAALRHFGALLDQRRRQADIVARWSGSKFAIAQPNPSAEAGHPCFPPEMNPVCLTTSMGDLVLLTIRTGTAQFPQDGETVEALYRAAEQALAHSQIES